MASQTDRLERLLGTQLEECCQSDVENRLETLQGYQASIPEDLSPDLNALKALSTETRHTIVRLLAAAERDLCVCEFEPLLDVSDSAVSHALTDLREAGLVTRRKDGQWRYYGVTPRAVAVLDALDGTRGDTE